MSKYKEFYKIKVSGNKTEIFEYSLPECNSLNEREKRELTEEEKIENRSASLRRSKNTLDSLIWCNPDLYRFVTLTFAENIKDLDIANRHFSNFIKRLNYYFKEEVKYIAVIEFQRRGAVHYHFLVDRFIDYKKLTELWGHGYTEIEMIRTKKSRHVVSEYLTKYLTKTKADDRRLWGRRCFFTSQNIEKPKYKTSDNPEDIKAFFIIANQSKELVSEYVSKFCSPFVGEIIKRKYIFKDRDKIPLERKRKAFLDA